MKKSVVLANIFLFSWFAAICASVADAGNNTFCVADYFGVRRITELQVSADGEWMVYAVETASLDQNRTIRNIYMQKVAGTSPAVLLGDLADAAALSWVGATHSIAFLSSRYGHPEVFFYDPSRGLLERWTNGDEAVLRFRFSRDGRKLVYITRTQVEPESSLYARVHSGSSGVILNVDETSVYDFINPLWEGSAPQYGYIANKLWLKAEREQPRQVPVPGDTEDAMWSWDDSYLAVNYIASDLPSSVSRYFRTSVGIVDPKTGSMDPFATGEMRTAGSGINTWYAVDAWVPRRDELVIRRIREADPWVTPNHPQWAAVKRSADRGELARSQWHPFEGHAARFFPVDAKHIFVENVAAGTESLFLATSQGLPRARIVEGLKGSTSLFSFSRDFRRAAYVRESLTDPPEIFTYTSNTKRPQPVQRTNVNASVAAKRLPTVSAVTWTSKDGTQVSGWVLEPPETSGQRPWPMITFVHGGPGYVLKDVFAPYFNTWPYPFYAYATNGMAVFLPNYRGTESYGEGFQSPRNIDDEPIEDILAGVRELVKRGIADESKLGISGHSHGAWLGPMTMTRTNLFRVGSFAEGAADQLVNFVLMSGEANREIHAVELGSSLYDRAQRYLEISPDLNFKDVRAASLYEAGSDSLALLMLSYAKASNHFDLPAEMVVYPRTGHNVTQPILRAEAAERNLDWFRFWLRGMEDDNPAKAGQYDRWRRMKSKWEALDTAPKRAGTPLNRDVGAEPQVAGGSSQ